MKALRLIPLFLLFACDGKQQIVNTGSEEIEGNGNVVEKERSVESFHGIDSGGEADVRIIPGNEEKVMVKADENLLSHLRTETKRGILHIEHEPDFTDYDELLVTVTVDGLDEITASGTGDLSIAGVLKSEELSMTLSGTGNIKGRIDASRFEGDLSGTGTLRLKGSSKKIRFDGSGTGDLIWKGIQADKAAFDISGTGDVEVKGGSSELSLQSSGTGDFKGSSFKCAQVIADLSGSGDAEVHAEERIEVDLSGSGDVEVSGDPKKKEYHNSGSGEIE